MTGAPTLRELMRFAGPVRCEGLATRVRLSGHAPAGSPAQVRFSAVCGDALPPLLHGVRVLGLAPGAEQDGHTVRVESQEGVFELRVRTMQLHRDCAEPFHRALPREPVPWMMRLGWTLLPAVLRLPGTAWLLSRRGPREDS